MAVTQQLVRLSPDLFEACRRNTGTLDRLLAFQLVGSDRYLDLDWASQGLVSLACACNAEHGAAVTRALEGNIVPLNPALSDGTVEIPPAGLDADDVRATTAQLMTMDVSILLAAWPRVSAEIEQSAGRIDDPISYYRDQFQRLQ